MSGRWLAWLVVCVACAGCGTTKWSDTARTATEQLLISDSVDRAVSRVDLRALAGKKVFLDDAPIRSIIDAAYLTSAVKQHMLASGAILRDSKDQADYIAELRAGAVGTNRHDLLFGVPALSVPTFPTLTGIPSQIPEIPFVKKTDQQAVTKISLFVYNRTTGRIVWQSGANLEQSRAKDVWVFGAGPFQRGTIYEGTNFAGNRLSIPLIDLDGDQQSRRDHVSVADEAFFIEPPEKEQPKGAEKVAGAAADAKPTASGQGPGAGTPTPSAPAAGSAGANVVPAGHATPPAALPASPSTPQATPASPASPSPPQAAPAAAPLGAGGGAGSQRPVLFAPQWTPGDMSPTSRYVPWEPSGPPGLRRLSPDWPGNESPGEVADRTPLDNFLR